MAMTTAADDSNRSTIINKQFGFVIMLVIAASVHQIESPDSPILILGDFNGCRLNKTLPTYQQYVTCAAKCNRTINLCYGNIKNAYKAYKKKHLLVMQTIMLFI